MVSVIMVVLHLAPNLVPGYDEQVVAKMFIRPLHLGTNPIWSGWTARSSHKCSVDDTCDSVK